MDIKVKRALIIGAVTGVIAGPVSSLFAKHVWPANDDFTNNLIAIIAVSAGVGLLTGLVAILIWPKPKQA